MENNDLEERRFLRVLQRRSTWIIMKYIGEHEKPLYEDLLQFSTPYSLNRILKELFDWGLIKCFFEIEADDNRVDLTEKMRKIFRMLQGIIRMLKGTSRGKGHVFVCVLSLLLEKLMEKHTNKPFREIKDKLEPLGVNRIEVYGEEIYKRNSISSGADEALCALGVEKPPEVLIV